MTDLRTDPIALAQPVRPQQFGRGHAERIERPVVEPYWLGLRVIVAATADAVAIYDDGEPVEDETRIESRLKGMIAHTADGVILDGYLTKQVSADDLPVNLDTEIPTAGQLMSKPFFGIRRGGAEEKRKRLDAEEAARVFAPDDIVNFVAIDLLWLDGEWLLDVPLLERKRLLEAVIPGDDLVRASPYVQPPYDTWIGSWRVQGFTALTFKEGNSRYHPGERTASWVRTELQRR